MEISLTNTEGSGALLCFFPDTQILRCALLLSEAVGGKHQGEVMLCGRGRIQISGREGPCFNQKPSLLCLNHS